MADKPFRVGERIILGKYDGVVEVTGTGNVIATTVGQAIHIVDTDIFDRPSLDELCRLTSAVRTVAKSDAGARLSRTTPGG